MSTPPDKLKRTPTIRSVELPNEATVYYAVHGGDVYIPSIMAGIPQNLASDLADRADVDFLMLPSRPLLFPSKWLAAVRPEMSGYLQDIRKMMLEETAAAGFAAGGQPNQ